MAILWPASYDTLTNPTASDPTTAPDHAAQHSDVNDGIEALQVELGLTPSGSRTTVKARFDSMDIMQIAASDETTAITIGTKATVRLVGARTLVGVRASLTTAQASGSIFTVDVNKNGATVLSTKLTIDNTEKTSVTAATAAVISVSSFADDDEIGIDVDQVGDGTASGLKVALLWG